MRQSSVPATSPIHRQVRLSLTALLVIAGMVACSDDETGEAGEDPSSVEVNNEVPDHEEFDPSTLTVTDVVPVIGTGEPDELPEMVADEDVTADSVRFIGENDIGAFWVATTNLDEEEDEGICLISGIKTEGTEEFSTFGTVCNRIEDVYANGLWAKLSAADSQNIVAYLLPPDVDGAEARDQNGEPVSSIELVESDGTQVIARTVASQGGREEIISVPRGEDEMILPQM